MTVTLVRFEASLAAMSDTGTASISTTGWNKTIAGVKGRHGPMRGFKCPRSAGEFCRAYDEWFCCGFGPRTRASRRGGMTRRRQAVQVRQDRHFKGRQFTAEVILWARLAKGSVRRSRMEGQGEGVRWYLMFPISYRDLELMLLDRGVEVDHTTIFRWIQAYAVELEKRIRPHLRMSNGSWRVDETYVYVRVKGRWMYLYLCIEPSTAAARRSTFYCMPSATRRRRNGSSARHWHSLIR